MGLDRTGRADCIPEPVEAAVVRDVLTVEQAPDQRHRLAQSVEPLAEPAAEIEPEGVVLALEPSSADAQHRPATRDVVDRGRDLRRQPRVAQRVRGDHQAKSGPGRDGCRSGERRPALELGIGPVALVRQQVIVEPQVVETGRLGVQHPVAELRPADALDPERRPEPHRHRSPPHPYRRGVADPDPPSEPLPTALRNAILAWFEVAGRQLAFRATRDPYAILVSELMAQQTQAARAAEAWSAWMTRFPTVQALAAAPAADVLRAWAGLGYNRRAIHLHRAAKAIVAEHGGSVPDSVEGLQRLPGVGPYTARAVAAIAFGLPVGAVDTNVRRVLGRIAAGGAEALAPAELQALADAVVPPDRAGDWTHALMDVGAGLCRRGTRAAPIARRSPGAGTRRGSGRRPDRPPSARARDARLRRSHRPPAGCGAGSSRVPGKPPTAR